MTKLITSLCLILLIQDGLLELDEDIGMYVPTLNEQPVLTGFDAAGQPVLRPRNKPITLRHLLTHSAGTGYLLMDERLQRWAKAAGRTLPIPLRHSPTSGGSSVDSRFNYPVLFEPGEGWVYGSGLDWAGRLIAKLTGEFFDDFMYERILRPIGVRRGGITFHPGRFNQAAVDTLAGMAKRDSKTGKVAFLETEMDNDNEAFGGEGVFGGLGEYMKVLNSLLNNDGKIIKPTFADKYLFAPLLEPAAKKALNESMKDPDWAVGVIPAGDYDWSAGGLLTTHDNGHRKKGFLQWGGAWNLCWVSLCGGSALKIVCADRWQFIDRESGVCGAFGTQVFPPGDTTVRTYMKEFEDALYSKL
jgi:CubicO group peptidase (beta-lactamase class C family)